MIQFDKCFETFRLQLRSDEDIGEVRIEVLCNVLRQICMSFEFRHDGVSSDVFQFDLFLKALAGS